MLEDEQMSKVISIFVIFFAIIVIFASVFYFNTVPKSLLMMKAGIIESGQKNGFEIEIARARIKFPNLIEFEDVGVSDFSKNLEMSAKLCKIEISMFDYLKSIFKREKVFWGSFSKKSSLEDIVLKIGQKPIFENAAADLFFEDDNLQYRISAKEIENSQLPIKNISAFGIIDSGFCKINSRFEIYDGWIEAKGNLNLQNSLLKGLEIGFDGIEISKILSDLNISGKIGGKIIPKADEVLLDSHFLGNIKETNAYCSLSISNFKDLGHKSSRQILNAVAFVGIKNLDFAKITAVFDYSPSKVLIDNFLAENFSYSVSVDGHYFPQSTRYDFSVDIRFKPDMRSAIQRNVWESMIPDAPRDQGRKISGNIRGEGDKFSISFDGEIIKRGINSFLSSLKDIF
jgi:hypothetical protein